jgi:SAM-dependent methyltransferase
MKDVLGQAIHDHYYKNPSSRLWIHNKYGRKEEMPLHVYFRTKQEMPPLELVALQHCAGKVLDIGAGAGSHALLLQKNGIDITALEISPKAAAVMQDRGVRNIVLGDIFSSPPSPYDTLLLLMNGIGLTATLDGLESFLIYAKKLIAPGGQLLFDSSDVAYLYNGKLPKDDKYYGEILYQYEYKKQKTDWFSWLYIDKQTLQSVATRTGWKTEVLFEDEFDQYLVKLTL